MRSKMKEIAEIKKSPKSTENITKPLSVEEWVIPKKKYMSCYVFTCARRIVVTGAGAIQILTWGARGSTG